MAMKTYMDYKYDVKNNEVIILKYTGDSEEVTIPSTIEGLPVRKIGCSLIGDTGFCNSDTLKSVIIPEGVRKITIFSFWNSKSLERVSIPASVTEINGTAFSRSRSLTTISVDENNPNYTDMDGVLFNKDKAMLLCFPCGKSYETGGDIPEGKMRIRSYIVPDGVKSIGSMAFEGCFLSSITLPDSVTEIGCDAFADCCFLKEIALPAGIIEISSGAFQNCKALADISIPDGVTTIGEEAFAGCAALTDISIPASVTKIRRDAFKGCFALTSISIPAGVTKIEGGTFEGCTALTSINLPTSVTKIAVSAFDGCLALERINVDADNPVYASVDGVLFQKDTNERIYTPHALRVKNPSKVTSIDDLAGMTDRDIVSQMGEELWCRHTFYNSRKEWEDALCGRLGSDYPRDPEEIGIHALCRDERVIALEFHGKCIEYIPESIGRLFALEGLYIDLTKINTLPVSIENLSMLKTLEFSGCKELEQLPEAIGALTALEALHVYYSALREFPESLGNCTKLKSLTCFYGDLEKLPESIGNLTALEHLDISYTGVTELPESFGSLTKLKYLGLPASVEVPRLLIKQMKVQGKIDRKGGTPGVLMEVPCYSRESIEALLQGDFPEHTAVVSFRDTGMAPVDYSAKTDRVFHVELDDMNFGENSKGYAPSGDMSKIILPDEKFPQLGELAKFIRAALDEDLNFICQCEAGVGRSTGCAAAIRDYRFADCTLRREEGPNAHVYNRILSALKNDPCMPNFAAFRAKCQTAKNFVCHVFLSDHTLELIINDLDRLNAIDIERVLYFVGTWHWQSSDGERVRFEGLDTESTPAFTSRRCGGDFKAYFELGIKILDKLLGIGIDVKTVEALIPQLYEWYDTNEALKSNAKDYQVFKTTWQKKIDRWLASVESKAL